MAINHKELLQFIEYIEDDKLSFGININNENQIETSLVWYKVIDNLMVVYHNFNPQTQVVLRWNEIDLNYPLELFLKDMEEFEHNYCLKGMKENYQGDQSCYTFFDFAKDQWILKVKVYNINKKS
jgi:hypothetical protein